MKYRNNQYLYSSYELSYFFSFGGWALIRGWALKKYFLGVDAYSRLGVYKLFSTFRVGAYSRWALIRDWVLSRLNTVLTSTHQFNGNNLKKGIYIELSQLILLPKPIIVSRIVFPMLFYFKL